MQAAHVAPLRGDDPIYGLATAMGSLLGGPASVRLKAQP